MFFLVSVNEFSFLRLCWWLLLRRKVYVLDIRALFRPSTRLLERMVSVFKARAWALDALDLCPEYKRIKEYPIRKFQYDVYRETADWLEERFLFQDAGKHFSAYDMACKHTVANYSHALHIPFLVLRSMSDAGTIAHCKLSGLSGDLFDMAQRGIPSWPSGIKAMPSPNWIINIIVSSLVGVATLLWTVARIRPFLKPARRFFFAGDFIDDESDSRLYSEMADGGPVMLVVRMMHSDISAKPELKPHTFLSLSSGRFGVVEGIGHLGRMLLDLIKWVASCAHFEPALFLTLATLPYRRLQYKALFRLYAPQYYWGRDPYNADHILRTQELNAIGGLSFGRSVGFMMTYTTMWPQFRYLHFDRFFVYGQGPYKKYYADTYPPKMALIPAGTPQLPRHVFNRRFDDRPADILFCIAVFAGSTEYVDAIRSVAAAFPSKKILVQIKPLFWNLGIGPEIVRQCMKGLDNVHHTKQSIYELFFDVQYLVSDPSSIILEAMQCGVKTLCFDLPEIQKQNVLREYPGLTVKGSQEIVERIGGLESGLYSYPYHSYEELVDLSGRSFFDWVRREVGLEEKELQVPLNNLSK